MANSIRYQMPHGAEIVSEDGSIVTMHVTIPSDDSGYFGRQCPSCKRIFRMQVDDYDALPDGLRLTCPYCCAEDDHSEFVTDQQMERATAAAGEYAEQYVDRKMNEMFTGLARSTSSRGSGISFKYTSPSSRSARPRKLPAIVEEAVIRERRCASCANHYGVFGEHVACPVCGPLPARVAAEDALDALDAALSVFDQIPEEVLAQLREAGSLERTASGSLGSVVSILEAFLRGTFLDKATGGDALIGGKGNLFQRLDDTAQLYHDHLGIDLPGSMGTAEWERLRLLYGIRHLATHTSGVVDQMHLDRFPNHGFVLGQRVIVALADAREAILLARTLVAGTKSDPT